MADKQEIQADQAQDAAGGGNSQAGPRTFTQDEVNALLGTTRKEARERLLKDLGVDSPDAVKAALAKAKEVEDAQKSELQKALERAQAAEAASAAALKASTERAIRSEFKVAAALAGATHPEDAYALADLAGVQVDDAGNVGGVADEVKRLVEAGRLPIKGNKAQAANLDAGAGSGDNPNQQKAKLTDEELAMCRKLRVKPEDYLKQKQAMQQPK